MNINEAKKLVKSGNRVFRREGLLHIWLVYHNKRFYQSYFGGRHNLTIIDEISTEWESADKSA